MGWNPVKEAEKAAKKVIDKVINPAKSAAEKAVNAAKENGKKWVRKAAEECERGLKTVRDEAEGAIKTVRDEAEDHLKKVGEEIEDGLTEKLPDLLEDALEKIAEEASSKSIKEVLDNAADIIEFMAPSSFTLIFGIELALVVQGEVTVALTLPNPTAKLTEIRQWADKPPEGRSQIIECIKDFAPESLSVEAKISGNGLAAEWDGDDKFNRADAFLKKHGVD